jgi:TetR/AcrR family transcriptional regulator, transcriptional repressor for nem operon
MSPTETQDTRSALIENGLDLVMLRGFASFSFQDLAERVGIRKASIHYHFPSKGALGVAMVGSIHDHLVEEWAELEQRHRHIGDRLRAVISDTCSLGSDGERICPIGSLQGEFNALPSEIQDALRSLDHLTIDTYTRWFEEGRARQEVTFPGDTRAMATCFAGVMQSSLQRHRSNPEECVTASLNQFLRLLGIEP